MFFFLRLHRLGVDDIIGYLETFDLYYPRVEFSVKNRGEESHIWISIGALFGIIIHRYKYREKKLEISIASLTHKWKSEQ